MKYLKKLTVFIFSMWLIVSTFCVASLTYADSNNGSIIKSVEVMRIERDGIEPSLSTVVKISLRPDDPLVYKSMTAVMSDSNGDIYQFSPEDLYNTADESYLYKEMPFYLPEGPVTTEVYDAEGYLMQQEILAASYSDYVGDWTGTTNQGYAVGFTVEGDDVTSFSIKTSVSGTKCSTTTSGTVKSTWPISNDTFHIRLSHPGSGGDNVYEYDGNFTSESKANGTWYVENATCNATGSGTWNASKAGNNNTHTLSVNKTGNGSGAVASSPSGINCGSQCSATFNSGTVVYLAATPVSGSVFSGWSGGGCSGTGTCAITLNSDTTVTATFTTSTPPTDTHTLSVNKTGNGSGAVASSPDGISCGSQCSATFNSGTVVYLAAVPVSGSVFSGWGGGGCSGTDTCAITLNSDTTVTATFSSNNNLSDLTGQWASVIPTCKNSKKGVKCKVTGKIKVQNVGAKDASSSTVKVYLSNSNTHSGADTVLKQLSTGKIKAGKSKSKTFSFSFPYNVLIGGMYIIAAIDEENSVQEITEDNNNVVYGPCPGQQASKAPNVPSNLTSTAISSSRIDLSWQDNSDNETGFKIFRNSGGGYSQIATLSSGVTTYQDTGLSENTSYYYKVSAFNEVGESAYSNEASATTPSSPPPATTPHAGTWNGSVVSFNVSSNGASLTSNGSSLYVDSSPRSFTMVIKGSNCNPVTIFSSATIPIVDNSFAANGHFPDGTSFSLSGHFNGSTDASGSYSYSGTGSECSGSGSWSVNY